MKGDSDEQEKMRVPFQDAPRTMREAADEVS
jgi:hypothetical protein